MNNAEDSEVKQTQYLSNQVKNSSNAVQSEKLSAAIKHPVKFLNREGGSNPRRDLKLIKHRVRTTLGDVVPWRCGVTFYILVRFQESTKRLSINKVELN